MDNILISGEDRQKVEGFSIGFFKTIYNRRGYKCQKSKLRFVEPEVKYLGHLISKGKWSTGFEWIEGLISLPLPETRNLESF